MKKTKFHICIIAILLLNGTYSNACNPESGERRQMVYLEAGGDVVEYWEVVPDELKAVVLPSKDVVGIRVAPASTEKYRRSWKEGKFAPELVYIKIYDMSGASPIEKEASWGGANSVQSFGRKSSASSPGVFGHGGFTLYLLKPVCANPEDR